MSKTKTPETAIVANYPAALCKERVSALDGSIFHTIFFKFKDTWASFILPDDKISQSVKRNGDTIPERFTLDLGDAEDVRPVSVQTEDNSFERKIFFNRTIKNAIDEEKDRYLKSIAI